MELHYYKINKEDIDKKYKTWFFIDNYMSKNYGWNKANPLYLDTSEKAKEWYKQSNKEDLHFIAKELEACQKWHIEHLKNIIKAKKFDY